MSIPVPEPAHDSSSPQERSGADLLVDCLISRGVEIVYGVPGDTGVALYDSMLSRQEEIRHVLARDERHAVAMADAHARATNRVGVVEVSSGGGTTFAVGGMGEAFAAGVPVLLITSDIHESSRGTGALTEIDQLALFQAVSKWRVLVEAAERIPAAIDEALAEATSGRTAPVVVIVPENVLDEPVAESVDAGDRRTSTAVPRDRFAASRDAVRATAELLGSAERPVILAGSGVHSSEAWAELAELAAVAGIPVATTIHGKGALADSDPWLLGVVGNNGARDYANDYVERADGVLLVGTRCNATDSNGWRGPARQSTPVAQIDIDPVRAGRNFPDAIRLVGDARVVLRQLLEVVGPAGPGVRDGRLAELAEWRRRWLAASSAFSPSLAEGQLLPLEVVRRVNAVVGDQVLVMADPGTPTPTVASYWEAAVGRRVLIPRGHGPMGYAIPAAIGACLASGEPVVSFTADGSFAMACGELETVHRLDLPILYVQLTNHSLGWIKMLQHLYYDRRYFGVDPGPIDAVMVAQACGLEALRPKSLHDLEQAVKSFAARPRPLYLDVEVPHMIDVPPPVSSWADALAGNRDRPVY